MNKIFKHSVFIISPGRTGTKYFGTLLAEMIPSSYSTHEPDAWKNLKDSPLTRIRNFGLYQILFGKFVGKTGVRNLSLNYLEGHLSLEQLQSAVYKSRRRFYQKIDKDLIIESHRGWFGAIEGIRTVFEKYKIVIILRDPRSWLTSNMNWGTLFGPKDKISKFGLKRLNPAIVGDTEYSNKWNAFDRFEKLCWVWNTMYRIMLNDIAGDYHCRVFLYEDLFFGEKRYHVLNDFLDFITVFSDRTFKYHIVTGLLEKRIHATKKEKFPDWSEWSSKEVTFMDSMCGDLMRTFGYGYEPDWLKLTGKAKKDAT